MVLVEEFRTIKRDYRDRRPVEYWNCQSVFQRDGESLDDRTKLKRRVRIQNNLLMGERPSRYSLTNRNSEVFDSGRSHSGTDQNIQFIGVLSWNVEREACSWDNSAQMSKQNVSCR